MAEVSTFGKIKPNMLVTSEMDLWKEKAFGSLKKIVTKDNTTKIWNMAMEFTDGVTEDSTKANSNTDTE